MYEKPTVVMEQPIKKGKRFFLGIVLFVLGIFLLIFGIVADDKFRDALALDKLNIDRCEDGIYVKGEVTDFVHNGAFWGEVHGVCAETVAGGLSQFMYTIYVADGQMIRVIITGPENKRKMDNVVLEGKPYKLQGELVKTSGNLNEEWYSGIEGINTDMIIKDYVIVEGEVERYGYATIGGIGIIVMAAIYLVIYCQMCRKGIVY